MIVVPEKDVAEAFDRVGGNWSEVGRSGIHIGMTSARDRPEPYIVFRRRKAAERVNDFETPE